VPKNNGKGGNGIFGDCNFGRGPDRCLNDIGKGKAMANTRGGANSMSPTNQSKAKGKGFNHSNDVTTTPGGYKKGR